MHKQAESETRLGALSPDTPTLITAFAFQLAIWGYAILGRPDKLAWVAERGTNPPSGRPWWDYTAADLDGVLLSDGGTYRPAPEHFALPGVTQLRLLSETVST